MITPEQREKVNQARGLVLLKMTFSGALNDETMPEEKMRIFKYKAFADWPKEMQDQLRPFGAALIDCGEDEPEEPLGGLFANVPPTPAHPAQNEQTTSANSSPSPEGQPTSSQDQGEPLTHRAIQLLKRYSPEEVKLLQTVPWVDLPQSLKDKTITNYDDPESQYRDAEVPIG